MSDALPEGLIETLPVLQRLALSYAPAAAHRRWLGLLALDTRLAGIVRSSREPMLAQLRLAWWREQFASPLDKAPRGEPLLAVLQAWEPQRAALAGLVDGWEAFAAGSIGAGEGIAALAQARGQALGALALLTAGERHQGAARRIGEGWALADIASRLADPAERAAADALLVGQHWRAQALPRAMRPLAVLHGLARRAVRHGGSLDALPPRAMASVLRIGLLGR